MRHSSTLTTSALALGAILSLLLVTCSVSSPEGKKAAHRERGLAYYQKGKFYEAFIEFQNVVQLDPKDPDGHYRLALTNLQLGGLSHLQSAFDELSKTTRLDPTNRDAHLKLGFLYLVGRDPLKATEQADEVLESAPQDIDGLVLRGQSLIGMKDYESGITDLKKAIELAPKNIKIRIDLVRIYVLTKDLKGAEAALQEALTVDPQSIEARLEIGDFRALTGRLQEAEVEYKHVVDTSPDEPVGYIKLAGFYQLHQRWADAEKVYQQFAARRDKNEGAQLLLGDFYTYTGQDDKARAAYQRAADLNPKSIVAKNHLIDYDLKAGKLDQAEARIKEMLDKKSGDFEREIAGRVNDARARLARGKTEEGLDLLQRVVLEASQSAGAHYYFGLALLAKNDLSQARRELTEAVKLAPEMYEARSALAAVHLAEGSPSLANEAAQAAIRLNPLRSQPYLILGDVSMSTGDLSKAKAIFEALLKATRPPPLVHFKLGLIALAEKQDADALSHFEQALAAHPGFVDALTQIVLLKLSQGKPLEARERVMREVETSPTNPALYTLQGLVLGQLREFGLAEASFKKAIGLDPNQPAAYLDLAKLYRVQGKVEQAVQEYQGLLAKNPKLTSAQVLLGNLYEQEKQYDKARRWYEAALEVEPKFWPAANNLAYLLAEQGSDAELDLALGYAETARAGSPGDPNVADTLGWIYFKKKLYVKAVAPLAEATQKLPNEPTFRYHYGMTLLRTGDRINAKKHLQAALNLSESFPGAEEAKKKLKIL